MKSQRESISYNVVGIKQFGWLSLVRIPIGIVTFFVSFFFFLWLWSRLVPDYFLEGPGSVIEKPLMLSVVFAIYGAIYKWRLFPIPNSQTVRVLLTYEWVSIFKGQKEVSKFMNEGLEMISDSFENFKIKTKNGETYKIPVFVSLIDQVSGEESCGAIGAGFKLRLHEGKLHVALVTVTQARSDIFEDKHQVLLRLRNKFQKLFVELFQENTLIYFFYFSHLKY